MALGLFGLAVPILVCLFPGPALGSAVAEPRDTVEKLHSALLSVMQRAAKLGFEGRREVLEPVIKAVFDLPYVARVVLSRRYWNSLSESQQSTMVDTFTRLSVATYAGRFNDYAGERFATVSEQPLRRGRVLVRSELRESDGEVVPLDYILHQVDGEWRIVNVIAEGVSDLSLKRAEYTAVMQQDGFDELMARLEGQIEEQAKE